MSVTLALEESLALPLIAALDDDVETMFVLGCRRVDVNGTSVLLVRSVHRVPDEAYLRRSFDSLRVDPSGWAPAIGRVDDDNCGVVFCHTHPGGVAELSERDVIADQEIGDTARERARANWHGSIVLAGRSSQPAVTGRLWTGTDEPRPIVRMRVVGRRLSIVEAGVVLDREGHDRDIRAFGEAGARSLASLRVGVVGVGGTGSAVVEMLARLGVRNFVVVDPDDLERSNVSRVFGSGPTDVGDAKVTVAAASIRRIAPDARVRSVKGSVVDRAATLELADRDVVFGCTDDHSGRLVLGRLPTWLLIPVIDCGVVIDSSDGVLDSIAMRVTRISVGDACLDCGAWVDKDIARSERLGAEERARLANEAYVPGLREPAPAVVAYTAMTAAMVVHELFDLCFSMRDEAGQTSMFLLGYDRFSTLGATGRPGHFCTSLPDRAAGFAEPFLGLTWV